MPLDDVIGPDDPFPGNRVGQPVTVTGTWVPDGTVYVSGRVQDGQDGYWVVTPARRRRPRRRRAADRARLGRRPRRRPRAADRRGEPRDAWLQPPEGTGEVDKDPSDDVLPQLRIADVIQHVDQDLYGAYGVATEPEAGLEPASVDAAPRRRRVHRDPQPALRHRVVVLRALRRLHLVAVGDRDDSARAASSRRPPRPPPTDP